MAVAYGTSSSVAEGSRTNTTYTAPASIANGDLLLIWHFEYKDPSPAPTPTAPGGFALVAGSWPISDTVLTAGASNWLWFKIASGESGDYTVTHAAATSRGIMVRVTGNDTTTPLTPNPTLNNGKASTTTWTTLTTSVDNELILVFASDFNDTANNLTAPTGTTPTFSERVDIAGEYLATGVLSPAGATGSKTMANNSTSTNPFFACMVAVQPTAATDITNAPEKLIVNHSSYLR